MMSIRQQPRRSSRSAIRRAGRRARGSARRGRSSAPGRCALGAALADEPAVQRRRTAGAARPPWASPTATCRRWAGCAAGGRRRGHRPTRCGGTTPFATTPTTPLTDTFRAGLDELIALARDRRCAIMCAEAVWWRCHRRIVADYLLAQGVPVRAHHGPGQDRAGDADAGRPAARGRHDPLSRFFGRAACALAGSLLITGRHWESSRLDRSVLSWLVGGPCQHAWLRPWRRHPKALARPLASAPAPGSGEASRCQSASPPDSRRHLDERLSRFSHGRGIGRNRGQDARSYR